MGSRVEFAVRAKVDLLIESPPKIVSVTRGGSAVVLLTGEARSRQVPIADAREQLVHCDDDDRRYSDAELASSPMGREIDRLGRDLRLVDGRHGLRLARHFVQAPAELGGVDAGSCTIVSQTRLRWCISSERTASVKPRRPFTNCKTGVY